MTAGLLTVTAAPASAAQQACNYDGVTYNACLTIEYQGSGWWSVHIGLDSYMPKWYCDAIFPSNSIFADLWGDDSTDHRIAYIPLKPGSPSCGSNGGLFAEFYAPYVRLDEDAGSDRDEVYGAVTYFDSIAREWRTYHTGTITGYFNY